MKASTKTPSPTAAARRAAEPRPSPSLLEVLAPEQRLAVERLSSRMKVDQTEVLVRLVSGALFVIGQDPAGSSDLDFVLEGSVPADRYDEACDHITNATLEIHDWAVGRNADERPRKRWTTA